MTTQNGILDDTLEFGLFDWIECDWIECDNSPPHETYEQRLKMLEFADRSGFYCYHLAEHHITPLSLAPSPAVFLAAAAQRTSRLRLGPLVYLLPFYHPIRLLHEICMLDHLWGNLTPPQVMRSIGLFVDEVMPALRPARQII